MTRLPQHPIAFAWLILLLLAGSLVSGRIAAAPTGNTVGLTFIDPGASEGYTLFSPHASKDAYLLDIRGRIVHRWTTEYYTAARHNLRNASRR